LVAHDGPPFDEVNGRWLIGGLLVNVRRSSYFALVSRVTIVGRSWQGRKVGTMNCRRLVLCGAAACFVTLSVPRVAAADDGKQSIIDTTDCQAPDDSGEGSHHDSHDSQDEFNSDDGYDSYDGHDAGERDRGHEYDGHDRYHRSRRHRRGPFHVRHHRDHHDGDDDSCEVVPPAEVPEAPLALLLPASGVMTGSAALLVVRRRSRNAILTKR
jgi:hypothetical protein